MLRFNQRSTLRSTFALNHLLICDKIDHDRGVEKKMPSRRSRSRSHSNERSRSPERRAKLPNGVSPITESQYFQKSDEFRLWLKEEKNKVKALSPPIQRRCTVLMTRDSFLHTHSTLILYPVIGHGGETFTGFFLPFYHALTAKKSQGSYFRKFVKVKKK